MKLSRLVLASGNAGKRRELEDLLGPHGITLIPQGTLGITDADEPHFTFVENALAKARHAAAGSGLPALADDSGVVCPALGGAPGVRSARYAGPHETRPGETADQANNRKLVAALAGHDDPAAHYYCVLVLVRSADDPQPVIADASWHGRIVATPVGEGGFGYDPHFVPDGLAQTAAQLPLAIKNRISHRGQALAALFGRLKGDALL